jgi:hypothetical protein
MFQLISPLIPRVITLTPNIHRSSDDDRSLLALSLVTATITRFTQD